MNISISVSVIDCEDPSDGSIWFVNVNFDGYLKMNSSLKVFQDLSYQVYYMDQKVDRQNFAHSLRNPNALFFFSDFLNLLKLIRLFTGELSPVSHVIKILSSYLDTNVLNKENAQKLSFVIEQLHLLNHPPGPHSRYSSSLLTTALLWKAHSTACYKAILRDNLLTLPSLRTLRRITAKFSSPTSDMENYLIMRQKKLNNFEKHVILIFDEIYVYQSVDYCNGSFVGLTTSSHELATKILTFMIKSVSSKYSDVVAIVPLCITSM